VESLHTKPQRKKRKKEKNSRGYHEQKLRNEGLVLGFVFGDRVSLCNSGWPQTHDSSAAPSQVRGSQACDTTPCVWSKSLDDLILSLIKIKFHFILLSFSSWSPNM
jgi:hypothetical protein